MSWLYFSCLASIYHAGAGPDGKRSYPLEKVFRSADWASTGGRKCLEVPLWRGTVVSHSSNLYIHLLAPSTDESIAGGSRAEGSEIKFGPKYLSLLPSPLHTHTTLINIYQG